ncbi:MAG: HmuY family protein [bacterium]|nr:HmuY family protein [bacterium]
MLKRLVVLGVVALAIFVGAGCGDDDPEALINPTDSTGDTTDDTLDTIVDSASTATTSWDTLNEYWVTQLDGSSYNNFGYYSFTTMDSVSGVTKANDWDLAMRREVIKTNGGTSSTGGTVSAVDLGLAAFDTIKISDTFGVTWVEDFIDFFVDAFPDANYTSGPDHVILPDRKVYSMKDAEGDNYIKFRIDTLLEYGAAHSLVGKMGKVQITYYYQPTAADRNLPGPTVVDTIIVGDSAGYYDFSAGDQVYPADPSTSTDWDICLTEFTVRQNNGPNGPGSCAAFFAWGEIADSSDIDGFTPQPSGAPMFGDIEGSALTDWYDYNGVTHQLTSKQHVYLINTGTAIYKVQIYTYYGNVGGAPQSGVYTFYWNKL